MIGKLRVHFRDLGFWHVAAGAVRPRHGTNGRRRIASSRFAASHRMARQAVLVVRARDVNQRLVRIVARDAGQASISLGSPAAAFLQAIGLKADINRSVGLGGFNHVQRGPMARAAEINGIHRAEICGIDNGLQRLVALIRMDRTDVLRTRPVTLFTMDSRHRAGSIKFRIRRRIRGVAGKTSRCRRG